MHLGLPTRTHAPKHICRPSSPRSHTDTHAHTFAVINTTCSLREQRIQMKGVVFPAIFPEARDLVYFRVICGYGECHWNELKCLRLIKK